MTRARNLAKQFSLIKSLALLCSTLLCSAHFRIDTRINKLLSWAEQSKGLKRTILSAWMNDLPRQSKVVLVLRKTYTYLATNAYQWVFIIFANKIATDTLRKQHIFNEFIVQLHGYRTQIYRVYMAYQVNKTSANTQPWKNWQPAQKL